jgi:hypothetical protein
MVVTDTNFELEPQSNVVTTQPRQSVGTKRTACVMAPTLGVGLRTDIVTTPPHHSAAALWCRGRMCPVVVVNWKFVNS